jgi:hypothetical protein
MTLLAQELMAERTRANNLQDENTQLRIVSASVLCQGVVGILAQLDNKAWFVVPMLPAKQSTELCFSNNCLRVHNLHAGDHCPSPPAGSDPGCLFCR